MNAVHGKFSAQTLDKIATMAGKFAARLAPPPVAKPPVAKPPAKQP